MTLATKAVTPLVLPDDPGRPSLELDTSELHPPPVEDEPATERPPPPAAAPVARPSLELDLEGLDHEQGSADAAETSTPVDVPAAHDAWTQDRLARRGTPSAPFPATTPEAKPSVRVARMVALPSETPPLESGAAGGALDLVERARPTQPDVDFTTEMNERFALGDFTGALLAAELLLGRQPGHEDARRVAAASRERLVQLYTSRLGPLDRAPRVVLPEHEVRWLGLDHRAGFLLSRIDGRASVEEIIDMSGMQRLEALRTIAELIAVGVVAL